MTSFSLYLLGAPRVERDGVVVPLERRKAMALLAYLAVTGECQRRESLAALFWPEADTTEARAALRRTLSVLNTALGGAGLDVQRDCVAVRPEAVWTDVQAFRLRRAALAPQASAGAEATNPAVALETLNEIIAMYRGDFLSGFTLRDSPGFDDWQFQQSEALQRELAWALEQLATGYAAQGDYRAALEPARRWVALDPLHEPAQRMLMKLYTWAGQPAAALRLYQECARLLESELGAAPQPETARLYENIRAGQLTPPVPSVTPPPIRLPGDLTVETAPARPGRPPRLPAQTTPLLGRVGELGQMADRLADRHCRLFTVLGPGGSGKTRLALQAAASYNARTEQPVYFVPLAAAPGPDMLVGAIAEALGLSFFEHADNAGPLIDALRDEALLLLLDNFEHLLPAAGLLADLLAQAPGVKVLVTSRERLQLHGEWVMELAGLPYPASADVPNSDFYDSVQLFVASARRARADFALDDVSRPAVVEICRLVEGMPLGLELAAPWVRMLSVQEIATEMTRNVDFLATTRRDVPARHRSLRAAFEHSWNLLAGTERDALQRLSVFRGGFLRTAAQAVAGASLPVLAALADKSLLRGLPARHGEAQFELHDLVRQFAAEKLRTEANDPQAPQRQHSLFYGNLLAQKVPYLDCSDWGEALFEEIGIDLENVRAAWRWAAARGDLDILELAYEGLFKFYQRQSWFQEGNEMFSLAITRLEELAAGAEAERALPVLAALAVRKGTFCAYLGQHDQARALLQRGLAVLRAQGTARELGPALLRAAMVIRELGDYTDAQALLNEALSLARDSEAEALTTHTLSYLGYLLGEIGEFEAATQILSEALERSRQSGNIKDMASALNNYGFVCYLAGDLDRALVMLEESVQIRRDLNQVYGIAVGLDNLGYVRAARGEVAAAQALFGEALRITQERHAVPMANDIILGLAIILPLPEQAPRAVELITFVLQHPLTWRETKDRAERWLAERACHLAPEGVAAAQARAHARTYEDVVEALLPAAV